MFQSLGLRDCGLSDCGLRRLRQTGQETVVLVTVVVATRRV